MKVENAPHVSIESERKDFHNASENSITITGRSVGKWKDKDEDLNEGCIHIDAERYALWLDAIIADDVTAVQQILLRSATRYAQ